MKSNASTAGLLTGLLLAAVLSLVSVPPAEAQINITGNINGTFSSPPGNAGPCPTTVFSDYANQCSGGGNGTPCVNFTPAAATTTKITGNFGTGTITSMCITVDPGNNVNEPLDFNTKQTCSPIYGDLTASTVRRGVTTNTFVNFTGVFCHHQANSPTGAIEAGFGIEGQDTDPAATGWGTLTGTVNKDTSKFALKLKGSLTP
jgi:hypothetical protein